MATPGDILALCCLPAGPPGDGLPCWAAGAEVATVDEAQLSQRRGTVRLSTPRPRPPPW